MKKPYMALYGNVKILKAWCDDCKGYFFVIDHKFACCDKPIEKNPSRYKRESNPEQKRKRPKPKEIKEQLEHQGFVCFYCGKQFNTIVYRKKKVIILRMACDHMVPYSYSQNNHVSNFVIACHICNGMKSNKCFDTIEDAREYLNKRWEEKGYVIDEG